MIKESFDRISDKAQRRESDNLTKRIFENWVQKNSSGVASFQSIQIHFQGLVQSLLVRVVRLLNHLEEEEEGDVEVGEGSVHSGRSSRKRYLIPRP